MNFDEELDRLRSAAEGLPADKDLEASVKWMILDLTAFIDNPKSRNMDNCSQGLAGYQDRWINFHKRTS